MDKSEATPRLDSTKGPSLVRWIVLGGFGGMLLLMMLAGLDSLRSLRKLHKVSNEVTQEFSERSNALVAVVVLFHSYDDQMESYLLSDAVISGGAGADEINKCGNALHMALHKYPVNSVPEERSLVSELEDGLATEEQSFATVMAAARPERKHRGYLVLYKQLVPSRMRVMRLTNALSDLNEKQLSDQNQMLAAQFEGLEMRLLRTVLISLVAGLLLALVSGYYILRLEQNSRARYLALAKSRLELERLSRRLVDAQEAERRSISRELHDEVGQTLGALLLDIGHLAALVPAKDQIAHEQIGRIRKAVENAVGSIRDMALLLRPPMLDDLGLIAALEWQARETSRRSEMEVEVDAGEMGNDPTDQVKVCVYRLVQEALQNAANHSHAKNAKVIVQRRNGSLEVEVSDDGVGFQPDRTRGMGILGMEERVRQIGGIFSIQSMPGKGTTVHAELPVNGTRAS